MIVTVTLSRLEPASGSVLTATSTPGVYTYKPTAAGRQTITLQTTSTEEGTCSVTLDTDEAYGYMPETSEINQVDAITYSGSDISKSFTGVSRPSLNSGSGTNTYTAT